jgi:TPR repeat protein
MKKLDLKKLAVSMAVMSMMCVVSAFSAYGQDKSEVKQKDCTFKLADFTITVNPPLPHDITDVEDEHVQFCIGMVYSYTLGEQAKGTSHFIKSAELGNPDAAIILARMHDRNKNRADAETWYRKALELGHPDAQEDLDRFLASDPAPTGFKATRRYTYEWKR